MRLRLAIAFALLSGVSLSSVAKGQQTPADMAGKQDTRVTPRSFPWLRTITPPRRAPRAEACVVLDADTFSHAAPALRDLRLYQDGVELPYVIEQSFDERALDSGATPADDRSLYESAVTGTLQLVQKDSGVASGDVFRAYILLPQHVPVERIRVENAPATQAALGVRAAITEPTLLGGGAETAQGQVDAAQPTLPFTIGAALQAPAAVTVSLAGRNLQAGRVFLEMRRRSLCYQPDSSSTLTLYLGGGDLAAESYPFARTFQSEADRPAATLGALLPNPEFHPPHSAGWKPTRESKLLVAAAAIAFIFFFNVRRHARKNGALRR